MAAPMLKCICHVLLCENDPVIACTDVSWCKITDCVHTWASLGGIEKVVADNFNILSRETAGFHRRCYQWFTNKKRLLQGQTRRDKGRLRTNTLEPDTDKDSASPPKFLKCTLRSQLRSDSPSLSRRSQHVLPDECIICRKSKKVVDHSTQKRTVEKLVTCETNAHKLLEAAKLKNDERILMQIGDFDPVCIEVRYHASCYKHYTKCVYGDKEICGRQLSKSFDVFCSDVIEKRIIENGDILKINTLTNLFIKTVLDTEGVVISGYRNFQLKARLLHRYPNLEFVQPTTRCCEIVFIPTDNPIVKFSYNQDDSDSVNSEQDDSDNCSEVPSNNENVSHHEFAQIYRSAFIIKNLIQTSPGVSAWPPQATDVSIEECLKIVPTMLFNFLAWCCGATDIFSTEKVDTKGLDNQKKILSLAQDILTLGTQGRKLMPKHLALGMTIRHLTGSAKLQQLLNSLGHCVSHSVTLEHDTALATQQLLRHNDIPDGFHSNVFTTLVWDNNDFGEETLSGFETDGKGTTHNTNGIIIQRKVSRSSQGMENSFSTRRDRKRTIEAPPVDIRQFHGKKRHGPVQFLGQNPDSGRNANIQEKSRLTDQALYLAKYCQDDNFLPGWTGCNQILDTNLHPVSNIGYLPVIDASPTEKSTVNTILEKSMTIATALNLDSIVLVMDQAIYAKAQEIRWQGHPDLRERLVIRLGEFHTAMAFMGAIGRRFQDAGLRDVAIESGTVAEGSINGVLNGHHYNRSLRCHKVIAEALHNLRLQDYVEQLLPTEYQEVFEAMNMHADLSANFVNSAQSEIVQQFLKHYQEHVDRKCRENDMYHFWSSYLQMVDLLLLFVRATREGSWELHLSAIRDMIPWFFAYGRINYSRYLPVYYLEMQSLPSTHPHLHTCLKDGDFAVKRHSNHGFAMTACDQVIEQTYNRDSKTRGGLTGITLNKGAVRRWILSHPARAAIASECYNMASKNQETSNSQPELKPSRIRTDIHAVQDVIATIKSFEDPFATEENNELKHICSGEVAPDDMKSDLLSAYSRGEECFNKFVTERLTDAKKDLYDTLSLPSGKTFSQLYKKDKSKLSLARASMKENQHLLTRLLIVAQIKHLDLQDVLAYPLSSVTHALSNLDGSLSKTSKSTLLQEVEKMVPDSLLSNTSDYQRSSVLIIDAMALIHQQQFPETFSEFAGSILQQLVTMAKRFNAKRVDFVGDRYNINSIKQYERSKRSSKGENRIRIIRPNQKLPKQMKKYLACDHNKAELLIFLVDTWKNCCPRVLGDIELYTTYGEECFRLYASSEGTVITEDIQALHSDQEEADTRMFLHAIHASKAATTNELDIIIRTVDTDVFILALWVATLINHRLLVLLAIGKNIRLLDAKKISDFFGKETAEALVGLHPFTGCDSVSAFKGKGKVKALKLIMKDETYKRAFRELGQEWTVPDVLQQDLEMFVCELYGWKDSVSINDVRYKCFRFGCVSDMSMPPNGDSLKLHVMRANYQARIYRCCLEQYVLAPSPKGHGWTIRDGDLTIQWTNMPIAPDAVLQLVHCKCKAACNSNKCSCRKSNMECTELCHCETCENHKVCQNDSEDSDS